MKSTVIHRDELAKEVFLKLVNRWDVKDRSSAANLARCALEIADGFIEVSDGKFAGKAKSKTTIESV